MLKTSVENEMWLVHQPDHARVSGYLAAHWGGQNDFERPGRFAVTKHSDRYRQEVVHAIAEHDNGWWEWEASPDFDSEDCLPLHLSEVASKQADAGLERWNIGIPRLAESHPYIALLISLHSYWLYAFEFDDVPKLDEALRHPIFGEPGKANSLVVDRKLTRQFLDQQCQLQEKLVDRLNRNENWSDAVQPEHLLPHLRLLQILDAFSLLLSFNRHGEFVFENVPRSSWNDRVAIKLTMEAERRIICDPYPFDLDPLEVYLPIRVVPGNSSSKTPPLVRLLATPLRTYRFDLMSRN